MGPRPSEYPTVPSDALATWHEFLAAFPVLAEAVGMPKQLRLVVDANVVLADLRWLVLSRKNPDARTDLEEVIAARAVVVYVPESLHAEVEKGIRDIAADEGLSADQLLSEWGRYRVILRTLRAPATAEARELLAGRDPTDMPYIDLQIALQAAAIYTNDWDLGDTAPVVDSALVRSARDYARAASISITIQMGGVFVVGGGIAVLSAGVQLVRALARKARGLPEGVQVLLVGLALAMLLHPNVRAWFRDQLRRLLPRIREAVRIAGPHILAVARQRSSEEARAREAWAAIEAGLPEMGDLARQPLRVHVVVAVLQAQRPLSLDQLRVQVRSQGFRGGRMPSAAYLRSVLRGHPSIRKASPGLWEIALD